MANHLRHPASQRARDALEMARRTHAGTSLATLPPKVTAARKRIEDLKLARGRRAHRGDSVMEQMKHVGDLIDAELDLWVARAEGLQPIDGQPTGYFYWYDKRGYECSGFFNPSASWELAGPIIERAELCIGPHVSVNGKVTSWCTRQIWPAPNGPEMCGPTPLIAAMRAIVAQAFGLVVTVETP
jgi:hypothetical protein